MPRLMRERADLIPELAEIFREYGFEGASLAFITERTGLGKGSLYNFFPGGKAEMAGAVLEHISRWFEEDIFVPLEQGGSLSEMLSHVKTYFAGGGRVCLVGMFALTETRDQFAVQIAAYFERWEVALVAYLVRQGKHPAEAQAGALDILVTIQGGLTLSRARNSPQYFLQGLKRLRQDYQG
ncbi:TetR/AcrR family transcriptional regulator [Deinococcus sp.]|uniref:TetR/AcrR family transcriptional regulator n=1 Tax=Deinococcus sp. TaxID=47478 RepID=UPI0025C1B8C3|nr:TetR/AcrR family transcriptional regulator [Deinococcus sp.]